MKRLLFILLFSASRFTPDSLAQNLFVPYLEARIRAEQIVSQMTLDEKISQVHGIRDASHYRYVPPVARLGIPALNITNGPAGVGPGGAGPQKRATALPAPIALAATWDLKLAKEYGVLAAEETRAIGSNLLESPDINIARVPQGGRVFESYGEDPWLVSRLTVANIEGIQSTGMIANVKHFLANNQETNRGSINELVDERSLREIYMPGFEAAVKEAHVASLMCAYPRVNGDYNCENVPILHDVLKKEWEFDGFVISDFGAVHSTVASIRAGLDLELPTGIYFDDALRKALANGEVPETMIDDMLVRRFTKMVELGWFAEQPKPSPIPVLEHGAISRQIADQAMVLLKNDGHLLPLDRSEIRSVALIGSYAVQPMTGGGGSSHVIPLYSIQPVDGINAALNLQSRIQLLDGNDIDAAVAAAKRSDIAIIMVGDDESEAHDHPITLPPAQDQMIAAVAAANPHTIVVLKSGSAIIMPWIDKVPAVLEAWYPGEEDGNAVADVLFGMVNPSGKLPLTFPVRVADTLAANPDQFPGDGKTMHYSEALNVGYRSFEANYVKPLFPFGFGLSYTMFSFADLSVTPRAEGGLVRFRVINTGQTAGDEVAQLYITYPAIAEGNEPPQQLKGFRKVDLAPGESKWIELPLNARALSYWSIERHRWQLARGVFTVAVGDSSANTPLTGALNVK